MRTAVILMSRIPRPGTTKTRLSGLLTPEQCAEFHRACLVDELRVINGLPWLKCLYYTGELKADDEGSEQSLQNECGLPPGILQGWTVGKQQGKDLGERMLNAAHQTLERAEAVIMIGSDLPWLTGERLLEAAAGLEKHDVVLGPAEDGGYYLIGLKKAEPRLFADIRWGTDQVLSATRQAIAELSLTSMLLAPERDLDEAADLIEFWKQAQHNPEWQRLSSYQYLQKIGLDLSRV